VSVGVDSRGPGPVGPKVPLALICRASIVLAVVGAFGAWRNAGPVSLDGFEGPHDGWLVVIFALIAFAGVPSWSRHGWLGILTVLGAGCAMLYTAIGDLLDDRSAFGGSVGWGLWLCIGASVALAACAVWAAVGRLRGPVAADGVPHAHELGS
jgi:hypothetical protein